MTMPDFLGSETVKLPVGGDFTNGLIGLWYGQVVFGFYSETDLAAACAAGECPKPDFARTMGKGFRYFYKSLESGKKATDFVGLQYPPKQMWQFVSKRSDILNVPEEHVIKFADPISLELEISTLKSKKRRHELHLIALPASVAAMAQLLGYETPGFDLSELFDQGTIFDDAFQTKMVGNPDGDYHEGALWQRRVALWSALGESNAEAYEPIGRGTKYDTTSEKLSRCLGVIANVWKSPVWSRVAQVNSPVVDAVYGDESKRLTIPALVTIYESKAQAQAAASEELARKAKSDNGNGNGHSEATALTLPKDWTQDPAGWTDYVKQLKEILKDSNMPAKRKYLMENAQTIGATLDESLPWVLAQ